MNFLTIDVETANSKRSSICSIGIVAFENGKKGDEIHILINPEDEFSYMNTKIHGITEEMVSRSPNFKSVFPKISKAFKGQYVFSHSLFDKQAITQACEAANLPPPDWLWGNTLPIAQTVWDSGLENHKLNTLCSFLGYDLKHHDALEDARACGFVLLEAMRASNKNLEDIISLAPVKNKSTEKRKATTKTGFEKFSEKKTESDKMIVFTGQGNNLKERLQEMAVSAGLVVWHNFTKDADILVIGQVDWDENKSSAKRKNAEKHKLKRPEIRIISENEFLNEYAAGDVNKQTVKEAVNITTIPNIPKRDDETFDNATITAYVNESKRPPGFFNSLLNKLGF